MQGQSFQRDPNPRVPYTQWAQHRAPNGLIYLSHPVTGEVKWLWSRHHDPKTSSDYLVNTITGDRQWVTKQNEHLCPPRPQSDSAASARTPSSASAPPSTNPFSNMPKSPPSSQPSSVKQPARPSSANYREIEAPKSLGLTADEVLMLVSGSGRRYIYNRKTKVSRWLPEQPSDKTDPDAPSKNSFARPNSVPKPSPSPFNNDTDDVKPPLRQSAPTQSRPMERTSTPTQSYPVDRPPAPSQSRHTEMAPPSSQPRPPETIPSRSSNSRPVSSQASSQQNPQTANASYPRRFTQPTWPRSAANGYPPTSNVVLASQEAAKIIQTSFRGAVVRRADVIGKLQAMDGVVENVRVTIGEGRYNLMELKRLKESRLGLEEKQNRGKRLLELEEYLTQQMMKVDGVESGGNQLVRAKRKQIIKLILGLTEEVDCLKKTLQNLQV